MAKGYETLPFPTAGILVKEAISSKNYAKRGNFLANCTIYTQSEFVCPTHVWGGRSFVYSI